MGIGDWNPHGPASSRPVYAYVGTGQFNSLEDDGRDLFAAAMARAKARGDAGAVASLTSVSSLPLTDVSRMDVVRRWGKSEDVSDNPLLLLIAPLISPGYPFNKAFTLGKAFERLRAQRKDIVLFDGGHFVYVFHSDAFLSALTTRVRPLAR